jgi:AraC-like DNA-binding protein
VRAADLAAAGLLPPPSARRNWGARGVFGAPVRFNAPNNEIVLASTVLELPVHSANAALYPRLLHDLDTRQSQPPSHSKTIEEVRAHIVRTLEQGSPVKGAVARVLGMSARTLSRRLTEAGTTFEAILDRTRRGLAIEYLSNARIGITSVAMLLGYSEPSPFFRAFARWFGSTPAEYRTRDKRRS